MLPLISIVMPVYNSEKYLEKTIKSILKQKYKNLELICVDDGSTDKSVDIINNFMHNDNRIRLIQQKNQYAGVARNNGLKLAKGKYIMFLDSDDFFEKNMLADLTKYAEKHDTDIIFFGYYTFKNKLFKKRPVKIKYKTNDVISPKSINDNIFQYSFGVPWNKFIKTDFVRNTGIEFQNLKNNNDEFFSKMITINAKRVLYISKRYVNYRINNSNSLQGKLNSDPTNFSKALLAMFNYMNDNDFLELYGKSYYKFVLSLSIEALDRCNSKENFEKVFDSLNNLFDSINFTKESVDHNTINYGFVDPILKNDICRVYYEMLQHKKNECISKNSIEYRIGSFIVKKCGFK